MVSAIERREARAAELEGRDYAPATERGTAVHASRQERALLAELRARVELARETYSHAREDGADRVTAGLAALRAAAQRHGIDREHTQGHMAAAGSIGERLARIVDRGAWHKEAETAREHGLGHGQDDIRARLGRILGREVEEAEPEADASALGERSMRERLQKVLAREKQVIHKKLDIEHGHHEKVVHRHRERDHGDEWEL